MLRSILKKNQLPFKHSFFQMPYSPTIAININHNKYHSVRVCLSTKGDEVPPTATPVSPTLSPISESVSPPIPLTDAKNSQQSNEDRRKFWEGAYNGAKSYIRYAIPLLFFLVGYNTVSVPTLDPEWFGFKMKQKRKPKYVLKVQPLEETLSCYNMALTEAREPVDNLDGPEWKKALKLKQIRQQLGSSISATLVQNLSDQQLLQLEANGKVYAQAIAETEKERMALVQEYISLFEEEIATLHTAQSEESAANLSQRKEMNEFKILLAVHHKLQLETSFFFLIKEILSEEQWKFLNQVPSRSVGIMLKNYFLGLNMEDLAYPTGIDAFVHKITHFPILPSRKAPKVFVIKFDGDIRASQVERLREEITGIITLTRNEKPSIPPPTPAEAVVDNRLHKALDKIIARKAAAQSRFESVSTSKTNTESPAVQVPYDPTTVDTTTEAALTHSTATATVTATEEAAPTTTTTTTPPQDSLYAAPRDRVVVVLKSGGGTVTGYGLAAAQLSRIKAAGLDLTVCVDEVAASGGYLMASVADEIYASPFAVLGSIGVVANSWNITERLEREGVSVEDITAGKYKRTLAPYKKPNNSDRQIVQEELDRILMTFKSHLKAYRPQMNVDALATGETWYGPDALKLGLVDKLSTSDDVILSLRNEGAEIYNVEAVPYNSMKAAGLLGEILGQDGLNNTGSEESSSGWLNQLTMIAMRYLVKSAMENIDSGSIGLPSTTADIGGDSQQQQHIHRAMAANSSPLLSSSHPKAMLVMSDRTRKM